MPTQPGAGRTDTPAPRAASFKADTLAGRTVSFPDDYHGKLVLLDFWATWCPPCRAQVPYLVKAQNQYAGKDIAILGVSLDQLQRVGADRVERFVKDQKMSWDQVYQDGQKIAGQYGVNGIPAAFLVDGDTGAIVASGDDLHGDALLKTIELRLKEKGR